MSYPKGFIFFPWAMGFIFLHVPAPAEPSTAMGLWAAFPMAIMESEAILWHFHENGDIPKVAVFGFSIPPRPCPATEPLSILSPAGIWG